MNDSCLIVLPARLRSRRFPGKVLAPLGGKPVVQWCWEAAVKASIGEVIIAADSVQVMKVAEKIGARAIMTSPSIKSGTDRVWEAAKRNPAPFVLNLQGDEPFISPSLLRETFRKLRAGKKYDIGTAAVPISNADEIANPDCVKVVFSKDGKALYFSRLPVPYHHRLSRESKDAPYFKHIGFYFYRYPALRRFVRSGQSRAEKLERLEQLRALENGMEIFVNARAKYDAPSIDAPGDLVRAERYLEKLSGR